MRNYARVYNPDGTYQWVVYTTDANGLNDAVYLSALEQCLQLNVGESPFYANVGVPQFQSIVTQVFPDFYVQQVQQRFAQYFASLQINRVPGSNPPTYDATVLTNAGANLQLINVGGKPTFGQ